MTGVGTNTYLLGTTRMVVIDPGPDDATHRGRILAAIGDPKRLVAIALTHGHADHAEGAAALRMATGAPVLGHADLPGIDRALVDGDSIDIGHAALVACATPGHAAEHLCFWWSGAILFAGDLVAGTGTIVLADAAGALRQYLDSLARMRALRPGVILPGHGEPIRDPLARLTEYLDHRHARDREIAAALDAGAGSVEAIVAAVYPDLAPALRSAAARTVRAHLDYQAETGRARRVGEEWLSIPVPDRPTGA
jgi:glyoxylase-like metal-dependent hydrolase (beta-lactamase superfamily II)